MKDATGELSMTAVAVVAIAAIAALFSTLIWPTIRQNIMRSTYCASAFACVDAEGGDGTVMECKYCPQESNSDTGVTDITNNCANPETIQCAK